MNDVLKKLSGWFGGSRSESGPSSLPNSRDVQHSMLHDGSEAATRGQLVQVLLRNLVRKSGMPPGLVKCQIQVMNSRSRGQGIYVRLVVKQWDERLMKYAFAFQKTLLTNIVQFEPKAAGWLQGISWQLEVADSCPLTELPGPQFWQAPVSLAAAAKPSDPVDPLDPFDIVPLPAHAMLSAAASPVSPKTPVLPELLEAAALAAAPLPNEPEELLPLSQEVFVSPDETAQDLERLFAIRDNELANVSVNKLLPAGYESTEPAPLQSR